MKNQIIENLISKLFNELNYLKSFKKITFKEYQTYITRKKAIERSIQISIQICIDIALRIISCENFDNVETNFDAIKTLIDKKILPKKFIKIAPKIISVRNRLIHEYDEIDDAIIFGIIKKNMRHLYIFKNAISRYLDKNNKTILS
jgi:uncharacterized protein YutE (UPF0331/DUF86 family)